MDVADVSLFPWLWTRPPIKQLGSHGEQVRECKVGLAIWGRVPALGSVEGHTRHVMRHALSHVDLLMNVTWERRIHFLLQSIEARVYYGLGGIVLYLCFPRLGTVMMRERKNQLKKKKGKEGKEKKRMNGCIGGAWTSHYVVHTHLQHHITL